VRDYTLHLFSLGKNNLVRDYTLHAFTLGVESGASLYITRVQFRGIILCVIIHYTCLV
jgi:hypothetical protein